jgi:hypothetical protein
VTLDALRNDLTDVVAELTPIQRTEFRWLLRQLERADSNGAHPLETHPLPNLLAVANELRNTVTNNGPGTLALTSIDQAIIERTPRLLDETAAALLPSPTGIHDNIYNVNGSDLTDDDIRDIVADRSALVRIAATWCAQLATSPDTWTHPADVCSYRELQQDVMTHFVTQLTAWWNTTRRTLTYLSGRRCLITVSSCRYLTQTAGTRRVTGPVRHRVVSSANGHTHTIVDGRLAYSVLPATYAHHIDTHLPGSRNRNRWIHTDGADITHLTDQQQHTALQLANDGINVPDAVATATALY